MRNTWAFILCTTFLASAGCASRATKVSSIAEMGAGGAEAGRSLRAAGSQPGLAGGKTVPVVQLDVYQLTVPAGAVSRDEEFWKRLDEQRLDVGTYDLLLKNGMRLGVAPDREWRYFKGLLAQFPAQSRKSSTNPGKAGYIELLMKPGVEYQNIFYLNDRNWLLGQTLEKCDNLLAVSYQPAPRRPGDVLLKVCPVVRGLRRQFRYVDEQSPIELVRPEQLFDLRLEALIPLENFLIIAPSPAAKWPTSLGATFLTANGQTEPQEKVLLLVPRSFQVDEAPPVPTLAAPKRAARPPR